MSVGHSDSLTRLNCTCKDCGDSFGVPTQAAAHDLAVGLSVSTRCPKCRAAKQAWNGKHPVGYVENDDYSTEPGGVVESSSALGHEVCIPSNTQTPISAVKRSRAEEDNFAKVAPYVESIVANLSDPRGKRVSILVVPTGWGKSTWLPYRIMLSSSGLSSLGEHARILVTQPRTATLRGGEDGNWRNTLPGFISSRLLASDGVGAGQHIGYQFRGESEQHDRYNRIVFVTDGICIQYLKRDAIDKFQVLIIDEAHEQSANMELIFALLKEKLIRYPNLRVVIASATIDPRPFIAYFGGPDQVFVSGPEPSSVDTKNLVVDRYPSGRNGFADKAGKVLNEPFRVESLSGAENGRASYDLPEKAALLVKCIRLDREFTMLHETHGDIIIFMPTISMVDRTVEAVRALGLDGLEAVACHAQMDADESRLFRQGQKRAELAAQAGRLTVPQRVIVATNYAETSVTFANLKYVIDSGLIAELRWDSKAWCKDQKPRVHTQAGCWQRRGRVGRTAPGEVFHLYEEEEFRNSTIFREFPLPEVRRSRLDSVILTLAAAGMPYEHVRFLGEQGDDSQQTRQEIKRAISSLQERGVFDRDGDPTDYGLLLASLETSSAEAAAFLSESAQFACSLEAATFVAFVESNLRPFLRGSVGELAYARWRQGCRDDLEMYLRIYHHWEEALMVDVNQSGKLPAKAVGDMQTSGKNAKQKQGKELNAQSTWARQNGLNHAALVGIRDARSRLLLPFVRNTHTKTENRVLDLQRLHKIRFVLAKTLVDWIYVPASEGNDEERDVRAGLRRYRPLSSTWLSRDERVTISAESACFDEVLGPRAFIALERRQGRGGVSCRHVVSVDLQWIEAIKGGHWLRAGRASDARLVYRVMQAEAVERALTADAVNTVPSVATADLSAYRLEWEFSGRVIRMTLDQEDGADSKVAKYLVEDIDSRCLVVVVVKGSAIISVGSVFRAHVVSADKKLGLLFVSQEAIRRRHYSTEGSLVLSARVKDVLRDSYGATDAFRLELEPGIQGLYRVRDGDRRSAFLSQLVPGATMEARVSRVREGRLFLGTDAAELRPNEIYQGEIVRLLPESQGMLVKIGPLYEDVGFLRNFLVPKDVFESLAVGRMVRVRLVEIKQVGERRRIRLDWEGLPA